MLEIIRFRRAVWAGLISLTLSVAACDTGSSGGTVANIEADRENVEAMSLEHADDTSEPSAAAEVPPARAVESESLPYAEVDDQLAYGYLAYPSGVLEPLPAIVMIHEWWGLNDNIRAMANRLAAEGYMVLAVDLYGGEMATTPADARRQMLRVVENPGLARENIRQALDFLNIAEAPAIASLGWCFGGGWSLNAAMSFPEDIDVEPHRSLGESRQCGLELGVARRAVKLSKRFVQQLVNDVYVGVLVDRPGLIGQCDHGAALPCASSRTRCSYSCCNSTVNCTRDLPRPSTSAMASRCSSSSRSGGLRFSLASTSAMAARQDCRGSTDSEACPRHVSTRLQVQGTRCGQLGDGHHGDVLRGQNERSSSSSAH